jgi:hypothetical protein
MCGKDLADKPLGTEEHNFITRPVCWKQIE